MDRLEHSTHNLTLSSSSSTSSPSDVQQRGRRFSDVTRDTTSITLTTTPKILSQDGARPLPTPDEQQHKRSGPYPWPERREASHAFSVPLEQHKCRLVTCSVSQVFGTPELLDIILNFLDTSNVVILRRTSRIWSRTVQESPALRLHLFSRPQWDRPSADFQLLDLKLPGLVIEKGDHVDKGRWIHIRMSALAARTIFEGMRGGLGSRTMREGPWPAQAPKDLSSPMLQYEDLYITQPPVLGMQAFITEPETSGQSPPEQGTDEDDIPCACAKLSCDAGITLDFLADTTLSLLMSGRSTKDTEESSVMFKAIVSFCKPTNSFRKRGTARSVIRIG